MTCTPNRPPRKRALLLIRVGWLGGHDQGCDDEYVVEAHLAPAVAAAAEGSSFETLATLRELLRRHGHVEIEAAIKNPWIVSAETAAEIGAPLVQLDKSFDDVLQVIATSAAPSKLTLSQERRLRELALFFDTANLIETAPWMSRHTWMRNGREWCILVCQLIGVDAPVVAAEAQILQEDLARDKIGQHMALFSLVGSTEGAPLSQWDRVDDPEAALNLLLDVLRLAEPDTAHVAARALVTRPDRTKTAHRVEHLLNTAAFADPRPGVWACLQLADDPGAAERLAASSNRRIREGVALYANLFEHGRPTDLAKKLSNDPERQIRSAVFEAVKEVSSSGLSPELHALVDDIAGVTETDFTCDRCGRVNPADSRSCSVCHVVTNRPSEDALSWPTLHPLRQPTAPSR